MTFDVDALLRQIKPEKQQAPLRPDLVRYVVDVDRLAADPSAFVPDTMVYIGVAARTNVARIEALIGRSRQYHSVVVLSELLQGVANYDSSRPNYRAVRRYYTDLIETIPRSRMLIPDEECWLRAGVIAGTLAKTQGMSKSNRKELYADALIYLSATKRGLPVLTRNVRDFTLIAMVHGSGHIITY